ncbi:hypothetical protein Btru_050065 [Bulinus truncatus]|nr:hypothetical protein Btru_050065 [Bulinus truncatus]
MNSRSFTQGCNNRSTWGDNCDRECSSRCFSQSCDPATGLCDQGCFGFTGPPECKGYCVLGFYGLNCFTPCPANCKDDMCDPYTGRCYVCSSGFRRGPDGDSCSLECEIGTWGLMCSRTCAQECDGKCYAVNGSCVNPACPVGKWGPYCRKSCDSKCVNSRCDMLTGACDCSTVSCTEMAISDTSLTFASLFKSASTFANLFKYSLGMFQLYVMLAAVIVIFIYVWLFSKREIRDFSELNTTIAHRSKQSASGHQSASGKSIATDETPVADPSHQDTNHSSAIDISLTEINVITE